MNNSFIISDKLNSIFKQCYSLFSLQLNNTCYLVYTYSDDGTNYYLLASKVDINSQGKYFFLTITSSEKDALSIHIYNLFAMLPFKAYSGMNALSLTEEYCKSNSITLLNKICIDSEQPFYSSSLIASTSRLDIDKAMSFYSFIYDNYNSLNFNLNRNSVSINEKNNLLTDTVDISNFIIPIFENKNNLEVKNISKDYVRNIDKSSFSSLKENSTGFTSTIYVIIGTICFLLAAFVVFVSIILIKNL